MNQHVEGEVLERELTIAVDAGVLATISKAEIDVQIATAHRFHRSVKAFRDESLAMVTLTEAIADECIYALPRDGKTIEGPSARFAEIIFSAWGNCRAGARVVDDVGEFVTAQGVFHDLQKNALINYEVKRRIVDSKGRRYKPDMIGVTANAACSIALRNAILKGVPKAFWADIYEAARKTIMGDFQTLANRRTAALAAFQKYGVKPEQIFEKLSVKGEEDISLEHLVTLRGLLTALKEGDTTVEESFAAKAHESTERSGAANLKNAVAGGDKKDHPSPATQPSTGGASADAPKADAKPAAQASNGGRPKGTSEALEKYLCLYKQANKLDALDDFANEADLFEWAKEDAEVLAKAYHGRRGEISS